MDKLHNEHGMYDLPLNYWIKIVHWYGHYNDYANDNWGLVCQKHVSRARTSNNISQCLGDVITCRCPSYLLLARKSPCMQCEYPPVPYVSRGGSGVRGEELSDVLYNCYVLFVLTNAHITSCYKFYLMLWSSNPAIAFWQHVFIERLRIHKIHAHQATMYLFHH